MSLRILATAALLASTALAKTDIGGCTSYNTVGTYSDGSHYATRIWYLPDTGEVCELLDCGGGRAPSKTNVPGCGNYKGTETYSPRFIDPLTLGQAPKATSVEAISVAETTAAEVVTSTAEAVTSTAEAATTASVETGSSTLATVTTASESAPATTPAPSHSEAVSSGGERSSTAGTETSSAGETVPTSAAAVPGAPMGAFMVGLAACLALL